MIVDQIKIIVKRIRYSKASILIAISFALFTDMVCYGIILPIIPLVMEKEYHKSQVTTGFLFSMFSLGCLVGTPIVGIVSDRIGRKIPFLVGMLMLALSTILFAYGHFLVVLFLARFVQGLSSAVAWVIGLSMVADIYPNDQFGTASGTIIGGNTIGALIGPIIGGVAYEHFGYVVPFYISALFAIVDLLIRLFFVSDNALVQFKKEKELKQNLINGNNSNSDTINLHRIGSGGGGGKVKLKQNSKYNKLNDENQLEQQPVQLEKAEEQEEEEEEDSKSNEAMESSNTNDKFNQEIIQDNNHQINISIIGGEYNQQGLIDGASIASTSPTILSTIKSSSSSLDKSEIINYNDLDSDGNEIDYSSNNNNNDNNIKSTTAGIILNSNLDSIDLNQDDNGNSSTTVASFKIEMDQEKYFYKNSLKRKDVWILLVLIILFAIGLSSLEPILPLIIENKFKKSTSVTSLLFGIFTLPFLVLSPIAGWLTDNNYIRRTKMTFIGAIITSICFPFISKTSHLAVLFIVILLIGSGLALFFSPVIPILTYVLDPSSVGDNNGKILSLFCVFYSVGICIGPVFSTVVKELSFLAFTLSYSILLIISTVIFNIYFMNKSTSNLESFN